MTVLTVIINKSIFLFNFLDHALLHSPFEIFFLDSVCLRHIFASQPIAALPVVLALEPQLLEFGGGRGVEAEPGAWEPARGYEAWVTRVTISRVNSIQTRAMEETVLVLQLRRMPVLK